MARLIAMNFMILKMFTMTLIFVLPRYALAGEFHAGIRIPLFFYNQRLFFDFHSLPDDQDINAPGKLSCRRDLDPTIQLLN